MATINDIYTLVKRGDIHALEQALADPVAKKIGGDGDYVFTSEVVSHILSSLGYAQDGPYAPLIRERQADCVASLMKKYPPTPEEVSGRRMGVDGVERQVATLLTLAMTTGNLGIVKQAFEHCQTAQIGHQAFPKLAESDDAGAIFSFLSAQPKFSLQGNETASAREFEQAACVAVMNDRKDAVQWFIDRGVDVSRPLRHTAHENFLKLAIHVAPSADMVEFLESHGALLEGVIAEQDGDNALFSAIRRGKASHVMYLLSRGVSAEQKNSRGETPLHEAASCGSLRDVELLLGAGVDVDPVDELGCTPLQVLLSNGIGGKTKLKLEALLKAGANPYARNNKGNHLLAANSDAGVMLNLVEAVVRDAMNGEVIDRRAVADLACHLMEQGVVKPAIRLIECAGFDPSARGEIVSTPLHIACRKVKDSGLVAALLEALVQKGFDLESRDVDGYTPLMLAAKHKNLTMLNALIAKGADFCAETSSGKRAGQLTRDPAIRQVLHSLMTEKAVEEGIPNVNAGGQDVHRPSRSNGFGLL